MKPPVWPVSVPMNGAPARQKTTLCCRGAGANQPYCLHLPKVNDPAFRNVSFDQLVEAYRESTRALIEGVLI